MKLIYPYEVKTKNPIRDDWFNIIGYTHEYSIEDEEFVYYFRPIFKIEINFN
jgi:hypothetical protein